MSVSPCPPGAVLLTCDQPKCREYAYGDDLDCAASNADADGWWIIGARRDGKHILVDECFCPRHKEKLVKELQ